LQPVAESWFWWQFCIQSSRLGEDRSLSPYENDIAALVQAYRPAAGPLLEQLAQHLSRTDLAEVESILGDIQRRIERFDAARNDRPADSPAP
jgi:hypothetical protein